LPVVAVLGLASEPFDVTTIGNLMNFYTEAKRRQEEACLLFYTVGMHSPHWLAAYKRLLADVPVCTPIRHLGDVDKGGFRIASVPAAAANASRHLLRPWRM